MQYRFAVNFGTLSRCRKKKVKLLGKNRVGFGFFFEGLLGSGCFFMSDPVFSGRSDPSKTQPDSKPCFKVFKEGRSRASPLDSHVGNYKTSPPGQQGQILCVQEVFVHLYIVIIVWKLDKTSGTNGIRGVHDPDGTPCNHFRVPNFFSLRSVA